MTEVTKAPLSTTAYLTSHHMQTWSAIPPLSLSSAGFDTSNLLYPISHKLSSFLHFKRRFILPRLPVLYYYAQTPTVKAKQEGEIMAKIKLLQEKKDRVPFLLCRTTSNLQVYTVHSFLGEPKIKEDPKPHKNARKRSRGWARACPGSAGRTDSDICSYSCNKL